MSLAYLQKRKQQAEEELQDVHVGIKNLQDDLEYYLIKKSRHIKKIQKYD